MGFTVGARVPDGATRAKNMQAGLDTMGDKWKRNTLAPRVNPKVAAQKGAAAWQSGVQRAITDKAYEAGVNAIDLDEMAATIEATPDGAVADGVRRRAAKVQRVQEALAKIQAEDCKVIDAMPQDTPAQRKARMDKNWELNQTLKARLKRALA